MALWGFRCYVDGRGEDVIRAWYDDSDKKVRNKFYSRLQFLSGLPRGEWKGEPFRQLRGPYSELGEVRFQHLGVVYRPIGFHLPTEFVLLFPATEKGDDFNPRSAPDTALRRREEVLENKERSRGLDWLPFQ